MLWLNLQKKTMKLWIIVSCFLTLAACNSNTDEKDKITVNKTTATTEVTDNKGLTDILWIDSVRNLGRINEGQKVEISFRFKNTGTKPLIIESVTPGCGCTVADYPKEPIAPGSEGEITGSFDSHGRQGINNKDILVMANTTGSQNHILRFTVEVIKQKS